MFFRCLTDYLVNMSKFHIVPPWEARLCHCRHSNALVKLSAHPYLSDGRLAKQPLPVDPILRSCRVFMDKVPVHDKPKHQLEADGTFSPVNDAWIRSEFKQ